MRLYAPSLGNFWVPAEMEFDDIQVAQYEKWKFTVLF